MMKLGIMSDSHGRVHRVQQGLARLDAAGAEVVIHCGDIGGLDVLEVFAGRRTWFVWGNTDVPQPSWQSVLRELDLPWPDGALCLNLDGKRIEVFHGHEREFRRAVEQPTADYLLYGHSHHRDDRRIGRMRVINPGALYRVSVPTVAVLDLRTDDLSFLELM